MRLPTRRPANACWRSAVARPYKVRRGFRTPCNIFSDPDTACEKHLPQAGATPHDLRASARTKYTSRHALQPPDSATSPGPSPHSATPGRPPDDDHAFWSPDKIRRAVRRNEEMYYGPTELYVAKRRTSVAEYGWVASHVKADFGAASTLSLSHSAQKRTTGARKASGGIVMSGLTLEGRAGAPRRTPVRRS
jgi:hypothetical protein